jgi:hypothetical protein
VGDRVEILQREELLADAHPAGSLEEDVKLLLIDVPVSGRGLSGL